MKIEDIKLETCPFCDGEGEIIHSKPDEGYIYSESVYAFVKCKKCNACGPITDVDYNHATSGIFPSMKINTDIVNMPSYVFPIICIWVVDK